jgi:hypothetical protein
MIHRVFGDQELAAGYTSDDAIRAHHEIAKFIARVRRQPPDYLDWPKRSRQGGRAKATSYRCR